MSDIEPKSPRYVTCHCQHCDGKIEFDTSQLDEHESRPVECPHCNLETMIFASTPPPIPSPSSQPITEQKIKMHGSIDYFGLTEWWISEFTEKEREYIELKYTPMGARPRPLTTGEISRTTQTVVSLLAGLAGWFEKAEDFSIGKRIIEKTIEMIDKEDTNILDKHFAYGRMVKNFYRAREIDDSALQCAIWACEKQIAIAPEAAEAFRKGNYPESLPWHTGYDQLAIILEKQKNYAAVIQLCSQAKEQGWGGNWERRIERCEQIL